MTPWLVHELRGRGLAVTCLDARHARAALKMQINKTDQNDAEGLAQIMRTGWYRSVHVKSFNSHRARALLGARAQLVGMTTRLSNHIRGVLKTFGMLPGAGRGLPFDRRVEILLADRAELGTDRSAHADRMAATSPADRRPRQIVRLLVKSSPICRSPDACPGSEYCLCLPMSAWSRVRRSRPVTIRRRASRADETKTISGQRGRSTAAAEYRSAATRWPAHYVRGGGGVDDAGQTGFRPEGLVPGDCQTVRRW